MFIYLYNSEIIYFNFQFLSSTAYCSPNPAHQQLETLCTEINGDALLYSMFRCKYNLYKYNSNNNNH